jgi:hypothetical protein
MGGEFSAFSRIVKVPGKSFNYLRTLPGYGQSSHYEYSLREDEDGDNFSLSFNTTFGDEGEGTLTTVQLNAEELANLTKDIFVEELDDFDNDNNFDEDDDDDDD